MTERLSELSRQRRQRHQRRRKQEFIKGPIPLSWLTRAARLPGKYPLLVGLALWFMAGVRTCREIKLTRGLLTRFGIKRKSGYAALRALEAEGLIQVTRLRGRRSSVTILDETESTKH